MIRPWAAAALCVGSCLATSLGGCSEPAPRVRLVRVGGSCGAVAGAQAMIVRALFDTGEVSRGVSLVSGGAIDDLPATTRQITVEIVGQDGGVRAVGKSAPLVYGELSEGAVVSVAIAPQGTACPTEAMNEPRLAPAIARAGRYVLLLGGEGANGPLVTAELYDPLTDRFERVEVPSRLASAGSFRGAVATTLSDGRVVITGGPTGSYMVFDPATKRFGPPIVLDQRFFHGAVAIGGDALLIAGGCRTINAAGCLTAARTTLRLRVDSDSLEPLASLERDHVQPTLLVDPGGIGGAGAIRAPAVLVFGSATAQGLPAQVTDLVDLATGGSGASIPGTFAAAATLDSGAVLTGFSGSLTALADTAVVSPQRVARPVPMEPPPMNEPPRVAPQLSSATLTTLEDGSVLALGQSEMDRPAAAIYRPTLHSWQPLELPPALVAGLGGLSGHRTLLLEDGSVLIVGAGVPGAPSATAWRFRPALLGPYSNAVQILPAAVGTEGAELTPSDPNGVDRPGERFELIGRDTLSHWAIVGGPRLADGRLTAQLRFTAATDDAPQGLAVLTHFQSPADLVVTQLVPGQPAMVQRHLGAEVTELCRGPTVPALPQGEPFTLELQVSAGAVTARFGGRVVLECPAAELARGAWGLGVLGAGARLGIDSVVIQR